MPRSVSSVLDVIGIGSIVAAGALVTVPLGLFLFGSACLVVSWVRTRAGGS